uniref:arginyltransferase n=2 Tax=Macrostomum lignano TaxID=282301 RepID=A0A1I8HMF5_9PLAT
LMLDGAQANPVCRWGPQAERTRVLYQSFRSSRCGYCNDETAVTAWMVGYSVPVGLYQELMNHGWQRLGTAFSVCSMPATCCPQYASRTDVTRFQLTASQRRTLRRVLRFVGGRCGPKPDKLSAAELDAEALAEAELSLAAAGPPDSRKARHLRWRRRLDRLRQRAASAESPDAELSRLLAESAARRLRRRQRNSAHSLADYARAFARLDPGRFQVRWLSPDSRELRDSLHDEYACYLTYQQSVHRDVDFDWSFRHFCDVMVSTCLAAERATGRGTYHVQYWLGDRLLGVDIVDVLADSASSMYFFYNPELLRLSPGSFSALHLLSRLSTWHLSFPQGPPMRYLYLGCYVPGNRKLAYKSGLRPFQLLCPETRRWFDFDTVCRALLLANAGSKYARFAPPAADPAAAAALEASSAAAARDALKVRLPGPSGGLVQPKFVAVRDLPDGAFGRSTAAALDLLGQLAELVGPDAARQLAVVLEVALLLQGGG